MAGLASSLTRSSARRSPTPTSIWTRIEGPSRSSSRTRSSRPPTSISGSFRSRSPRRWPSARSPKEALDSAAAEWEKVTERRGRDKQKAQWGEKLAEMKALGIEYHADWAARRIAFLARLPEVEAARRVIERVAVGRRIVEVRCADDGIRVPGRLTCAGAACAARSAHSRRPSPRQASLAGARPPAVADLPLRMTGGFHSPAVKSVKLKSSGNKDRDSQWPPRFWKLQMKFAGGGELAMTDARRLAASAFVTIPATSRDQPARLRRAPRAAVPRTFHELLHPRTAPIKACCSIRDSRLASATDRRRVL